MTALLEYFDLQNLSQEVPTLDLQSRIWSYTSSCVTSCHVYSMGYYKYMDIYFGTNGVHRGNYEIAIILFPRIFDDTDIVSSEYCGFMI